MYHVGEGNGDDKAIDDPGVIDESEDNSIESNESAGVPAHHDPSDDHRTYINQDTGVPNTVESSDEIVTDTFKDRRNHFSKRDKKVDTVRSFQYVVASLFSETVI